MRSLTFGANSTAPLQILAIGAHSDDIEIGCGGSLLRLIAEHPGCAVRWVVLSGSEARACEARASAADLLAGVENPEIVVGEFKDGFFPYQGAEVKTFFEGLKTGFHPDIIFTHRRDDAHQDHRVVAELTWNTFRDHLILEYEIPKYDGDLGAPNIFISLSEAHCQRKTQALLHHFASQRTKHWFSADLFLGLLRLRGMEANSPTTYAEGFYCRKAVL
ncbi:MAG TPA: PIG-L deacetylase family protein [Thermomicrobiales bacterium]|jgi:LmbE family N-acetylglucosaminyl deacetylase